MFYPLPDPWLTASALLTISTTRGEALKDVIDDWCGTPPKPHWPPRHHMADVAEILERWAELFPEARNVPALKVGIGQIRRFAAGSK